MADPLQKTGHYEPSRRERKRFCREPIERVVGYGAYAFSRFKTTHAPAYWSDRIQVARYHTDSFSE